jgi:hypothetical protein
MKKVTINENASIFHDPYSGVTIARGEVVELTLSQLSQKRIRQALSAGHIVYANEDVKVESKPEVPVEELKEKFLGLMVSEKGQKALPKAFTLGQLKNIAVAEGYEVDDSDTKASLIEALLAEFQEVEETK